MPWWCDKHKQHSMDDVCSGCDNDQYLKDFRGFKAGIAYGENPEKFPTDREAYDHWKKKHRFKGKLRGIHE